MFRRNLVLRFLGSALLLSAGCSTASDDLGSQPADETDAPLTVPRTTEVQSTLPPVGEWQIGARDVDTYLNSVYEFLTGFDSPDSPFFDRANDPEAIEGGEETCAFLAEGGTLDAFTITLRKWREAEPRRHAFRLASAFAAISNLCPEFRSQIADGPVQP